MKTALWATLGEDLSRADVLVMAAAVADYRPGDKSPTKIKRKDLRLSVELVQNPDILSEIGAARAQRESKSPLLVGFALETGDGGQGVVEYARGKLGTKKVDIVVANEASVALGGDDTRATFVTTEREDALPAMAKEDLADALLDRVRAGLL